jgi:hypothetical protein
MRMDRETKRTLTQLLSSAAVACLSTLVLKPIANGSASQMIGAGLAAALLQAAALMLSRR